MKQPSQLQSASSKYQTIDGNPSGDTHARIDLHSQQNHRDHAYQGPTGVTVTNIDRPHMLESRQSRSQTIDHEANAVSDGPQMAVSPQTFDLRDARNITVKRGGWIDHSPQRLVNHEGVAPEN